MSSSVTIRAAQDGANYLGGIAGFNKGGISLSTSGATITPADNDDCFGAICGENDGGTLENNYYTACTVAGVENATNVGSNKADVTDNDGAVPALRDNADNSTAIALLAAVSDFLSFNVSLTGRTLYKDGYWNTLCLPFDVYDADESDDKSFTGTPLEGATVMELGNSGGCNTGFDASNGTLYLDFVDTDRIEAGHAYIVRWGTPESSAGGVVENPVFKSVSLVNEAPDDHKVVSADAKVKFCGTYKPVSIGEGGSGTQLFFCADGKLYNASSTTAGGALRAYLWLDAISSTGASGDVNGDSSVTIADVTMLVDVILGKRESENTDINGDGFVTIADVTALVNKILGKENTLQSVVTNIDGLEYGGTSQETVLAR